MFGDTLRGKKRPESSRFIVIFNVKKECQMLAEIIYGAFATLPAVDSIVAARIRLREYVTERSGATSPGSFRSSWVSGTETVATSLVSVW